MYVRRESTFCHRSRLVENAIRVIFGATAGRAPRVSEMLPVRMRMWTQTREEPPRLVCSPERIHCPNGTWIDRRQVYPPRNLFYSLSKSVFCGRINNPTESASTFCKDSIMLLSLLSLLLIRFYYYVIDYW